ncbi:3-oxoacyl-[acyl-carrier-protein] synthase II [Micromonospora sp. A202]|uniref:beta-ketoacyl synthase N-terminal-like domain-containing protein n=1 Tax=Micromonospora sp. A202 TaxID=2572899 RepID=UPI00114EF58A|nr:beta-ketoacyl synthase N-terminal-like domain-containing protein [Micromonospora sp. A202]TQJ23670.1 3-oxoacyl-[acyl-carrier-protein] synthase II [Micromonospora sp. A202]
MTPEGRRAVVTGLGLAVAGLEDAGDLLQPRGDRRDPAPADPVRRLTGRGLRYKDRATKLALVAGRDALRSAGLVGEDDRVAVPGERVGVVVSTNLGNVDTVCDTVQAIAEHTYLGTSPMTLPATSSNVVASWLAITYGLRGANLTLCNGQTSGLDAVHWAALLIAAGRADRVLVAGAEPDNAPVRHVLSSSGVTAEPFDGAAALVLEAESAVLDRGVRPLAVVGRYARRASLTTAVAQVTAGAAPVGLWCLPERGSDPMGDVVTGAHRIDLSATLGPASGALGVLQCVAAAAWLCGPHAGSVLATAGIGDAGGEDAAAAVVLSSYAP